MNNIIPVIIAIMITFSNKQALIAQDQLDQYIIENQMPSISFSITTLNPKRKLPKNARLARYNIFYFEGNNKLIFGMIYADSKYANSICLNHYIKDTYDKDNRILDRQKSDNYLNKNQLFKIYTVNNKTFYIESDGYIYRK